MPTIKINNAARTAIHDFAARGGRQLAETAVNVGPDVWEVPLAQDTVDILDRIRKRQRLASYSDAILWLSSNQPWSPRPH